MAAECFSNMVCVNAGFVSREVLVDDKGAFNWPVFVDLVHDCFFICRNSKQLIKLTFQRKNNKPVSYRAVVLVLSKVAGVSVDAFVRAFRCGTLLAGAWRPIAFGVVLARLDRVRLTACAVIQSTRDKSVLHPVFPSSLNYNISA